MRLSQSFPDVAIVYGVAPWVVWKESTVVECVLSLYPHYPLPTLLARHEISDSSKMAKIESENFEKL